MTNYSPTIISLEDHTVTDPGTIVNTFNGFCFFCSVIVKVQSEVPFSYNTYFEYLPPPNQDLYKRRKTFCLKNRQDQTAFLPKF